MADKLHKTFLLMLDTTSPGEIVAARDALVRLARTEGHDVHSLARALVLSRKPNGGAGAKDSEKLGTQEMAGNG